MSSTTRKPREGEPLSPNETEIMRYVCNGCRLPEVAAFMGASRHTTEGYMRHILLKLAASTQAEAAYIVARRGLFDIQGPPKPSRAFLRSLQPKRPPRRQKQRTAQTAAPNSVFAWGQV